MRADAIDLFSKPCVPCRGTIPVNTVKHRVKLSVVAQGLNAGRQVEPLRVTNWA